MASKKLKVAGLPGTDPTLPRVELVVNGESYFLAFTFRALALAQKHLRLIGYDCNLLQALDLRYMDAEKFIPLLYAGLLMHQPAIEIDAVADLVTLDNYGEIYQKIVDAYVASVAKPSDEDAKANPDQPAV
jgi:hypothetical protein